MLCLCCPRCPWAVLAAGSGGTHHALSTPGHRSSSSEQLQPCASLSRAGLCWAEPWEGTGSWWVPGVGAGAHSCLCAPAHLGYSSRLAVGCCQTLQAVRASHLTSKPSQVWDGSPGRARVPLLEQWSWAVPAPLGSSSQHCWSLGSPRAPSGHRSPAGPFVGLSQTMAPPCRAGPLSLSPSPFSKPVQTHPTYVGSREGWLQGGPLLQSQAHPKPLIPLGVVLWALLSLINNGASQLR